MIYNGLVVGTPIPINAALEMGAAGGIIRSQIQPHSDQQGNNPGQVP